MNAGSNYRANQSGITFVTASQLYYNPYNCRVSSPSGHMIQAHSRVLHALCNTCKLFVLCQVNIDANQWVSIVI